MASMQVRVTLLYGSCSVRDQPDVCECARKAIDLGFFGWNGPHQLRPERAGCPHLGDLHEEVLPLRPEERETRGERVDVDPRPQAGPHIFEAIRQGIGHFQVSRSAGLLHVVAGDGDRIELRHPRRGEGEDVGDDPHRGSRRINIGVPHHVLLQDVVLDGPGELFDLNPLLLRRHDVERQDREHRAVHRHRDRDPIQRNAIEEHLHVQDGVHRHTRLPNIGKGARMIRVIAAMGGKIESNREALLTASDVASVKSVGFLGRGKPGVLPHRPRPRHIHRPIRAAKERRKPGDAVQPLTGGEIRRGVERLNIELLERPLDPRLRWPAGFLIETRPPLRGRGCRNGHLVRQGGKIGKRFHGMIPPSFRVIWARTSTASARMWTKASTPAALWAST